MDTKSTTITLHYILRMQVIKNVACIRIYFRNASDKNSSNQENLAIAINVSHLCWESYPGEMWTEQKIGQLNRNFIRKKFDLLVLTIAVALDVLFITWSKTDNSFLEIQFKTDGFTVFLWRQQTFAAKETARKSQVSLNTFASKETLLYIPLDIKIMCN